MGQKLHLILGITKANKTMMMIRIIFIIVIIGIFNDYDDEKTFSLDMKSFPLHMKKIHLDMK